MENYKSEIIVIGVNYSDIFSEIENNILKSNLFSKNKIWTIERWRDEVNKTNQLKHLL